jgi:hypothetical protein
VTIGPAEPVPRERQRRVAALALETREVADAPILRAAIRAPVHELVLDEEDRLVVLDRLGEHAAEVVTLARRDDRDPGHADEQLFERLAVRGAVAAAAAHRGAHDERHRHPVVEHRAELRDPVHDLVEPERDEVAEHDLQDRAIATEREARRDAEHGRLADRRRQHAVGPARGEPLAELERAAVRVEQVLAEQVDPLVALEDLV